MQKVTENNRLGFTLIELAIVIVIVGLIVGGVLGANSLIKSAKISKTGAEINQLRSAYMTFEDQYGQIPGDFDEAEEYWPGQTLNGNGNKQIDGNGWFSGGSTYEAYCAWNHLYLSEMFPYLNVDCSGAFACCAPYEGSAPTSKGLAVTFMFSTQFTPSATKQGVMFKRGKGSNLPANLKVRDLYKLDKKFDDGLRTKGIIAANGNGYVNEVSTSSVCGSAGSGDSYIISGDENTICRYQIFTLGNWEHTSSP